MTDWLTYHAEPIKLHSGEESHWFVDADRLWEDFQLGKAALDTLEEYLRNWPAPAFLVAIPTGGNKWAEALAKRIGCNWNILGQINSQRIGDRHIYVVDDVVTTGASLAEAEYFVYSKIGRYPDGFLAVVNRGRFHRLAMRTWCEIQLP